MIVRVWRGWTVPENADTYEDLLKTSIFPEIKAREIDGFLEIQLLRRAIGEEVEFVTLMWFDSMDAVRAFAGDDHERAYVPHEAREILAHHDEQSRHFERRA